jgi:hypothetical protein
VFPAYHSDGEVAVLDKKVVQEREGGLKRLASSAYESSILHLLNRQARARNHAS